MAKKAAIQEMTELYENGMTLQEIGDRYGVSRQRVSQRFKEAGLHIARPPKFSLIEKDRLETLYAGERLSIVKIGEAFGVKLHLIHQALGFHRIPKRNSIKSDGKYVDLLRKLKIGESVEIVCDAKNPYVMLHRSAKCTGVKISMKKIETGIFQITRII